MGVNLLLRNLFFLASSLLVFASDSYVYKIFVAVLFFSLQCFVGRISIAKAFRLLFIPMIFIAIGAITILVQINSGDSLIVVKDFYIGYNSSSIIDGLGIFARSISLISIFYLYILTTSISEIAVSLSKIRLPALFIEMMVLIYKFIFNLVHLSYNMRLVQTCRCANVRGRGRIIAFSYMIANVFSLSFSQLERQHQALCSRGVEDSVLFVEDDKSYNKSYGMLFFLLIIQLLIFILLMHN